jgi:peptidyl-prolyl cis-trans isomerase SurA
MLMTKTKILSAMLISVGLISTGYAKPHQESLDGIVAVVNDGVITRSEMNQALTLAKKQLVANNIAAPANDVMSKQVLDQLINRKLQMQLGNAAGVKIDDAEITKTISTIAAQNKVSTKELYTQIAHQGMTPDVYRKELREELVLQKIQQQEVGSRISITPQEVSDFTRSAAWQAFNDKEYHLEDILIALPDAPSVSDVAAAKSKAEAVLAKIHGGAKFSEAASSSAGIAANVQGGDLGWRKLPQIPTAFASELVHLKQNQVMGPVLAPNGFHLVKLAGIRTASEKQHSADQKKQIEQLIYQRKFEEQLQSWMTKIRGQAFINTQLEA